MVANVHSLLCKVFGVGKEPELSFSVTPPPNIFLSYAGIDYLVTEITPGRTSLQYGESRTPSHLTRGLQFKVTNISKQGSVLGKNPRVVIDMEEY